MSICNDFTNWLDYMDSPFELPNDFDNYEEIDFCNSQFIGSDNLNRSEINNIEVETSKPATLVEFRSILKWLIKTNLRHKIESKIGKKWSDEARILLVWFILKMIKCSSRLYIENTRSWSFHLYITKLLRLREELNPYFTEEVWNLSDEFSQYCFIVMLIQSPS